MHNIFFNIFSFKNIFWDFSPTRIKIFCMQPSSNKTIPPENVDRISAININWNFILCDSLSSHTWVCVRELYAHSTWILYRLRQVHRKNYNLCAFEQFHECEWYILFFSSSAYKKTIPAHTFECLFMFSVAVGWISELFFSICSCLLKEK